jgi:hypothetical protein
MAVSGPLALTPEVDAFRAQFAQISDEADALVARLSDAQFAWQPAPESWSVAQCIDHLNSTAREYLPMMDEGIADAIRRGLYRPGPYVYNWIGRLMVWFFDPKVRFRVKTPASFQPPVRRPRQDVMAAFRAYQVQYIDRLRQANGLDLAKARVTSPVSRAIRLPLGSAFALTVAHERRHLQQARRVIEKCPL